MKRRRHTPDQIVRKLREADRLLGEGQELPAVVGYDHDKYRRDPGKRGVKHVIGRRGSDHGSELGRERWVVERTFAHPDNRAGCAPARNATTSLHLAFMLLGCAVVCQRHLSAP